MKIQLRMKQIKDKQMFFVTSKRSCSQEYTSIERLYKDTIERYNSLGLYQYISKENSVILREHNVGSVLDFFRKARNTHPEYFI